MVTVIGDKLNLLKARVPLLVAIDVDDKVDSFAPLGLEVEDDVGIARTAALEVRTAPVTVLVLVQCLDVGDEALSRDTLGGELHVEALLPQHASLDHCLVHVEDPVTFIFVRVRRLQLLHTLGIIIICIMSGIHNIMDL